MPDPAIFDPAILDLTILDPAIPDQAIPDQANFDPAILDPAIPRHPPYTTRADWRILVVELSVSTPSSGRLN